MLRLACLWRPAAAHRRAAIAFVVLAFAADLLWHPGGRWATTVVDDVLTMSAALLAAAAAGCRARRLHGRARRSWLIMTAGFGCAALGEVIWGWYDLVLRQDPPFPGVADIAYLSFPVLVLVALLLRPSFSPLGQGRVRTVLDGLLVVGSLFNLSWVTALGATYSAGGSSRFGFVVGLSYPVSDVILVTVTLGVLVRARARGGLAFLAAGLLVTAVSDSMYCYVSAQGTYRSGDLLDVGYVLGYLLLAEAAVRDRAPEERLGAQPSSLPALVLPYLPAAAGIGIAVWQLHPGSDNPAVMVGSALVVILFARQLLTLLDNRRLLSTVLAQQAELSHIAFHDPLTGLANRALFADRLNHAVALHDRDIRPVAVLLADLDDFKNVNDSLGHPAGDELLVRVAERLRAATRPGDTVARLGGDEFAVLVEDGSEAVDTAERILRALEHPVFLNGREVPVPASIGIACLDPDVAAITGSELLKRADIAMYAAKRRGKNTVHEYDPSTAHWGTEELDLRADLSAALRADELDIHYQPIFGADRGLIGFESLSRWTLRGDPVSPATFLPVAERAGLLGLLDEQVLLRTLEFAARVDPTRTLLFTVNLGVEQLLDPAMPGRVEHGLRRFGLLPRQLAIEIPEQGDLTNLNCLHRNLRALRTLGVQIALDDFGKGWSSLERLQALTPDLVKIDLCFVEPLKDPAAPTDLVSGMIHLAHRLGATVIAEGIETPQQLKALTELGCDATQGFLIGRPMPSEQAAHVAHAARRTSTVPIPRTPVAL